MYHGHSIPFEIWGDIFKLARPIEAEYEVNFYLRNSPTSVSQTCKEWRDIAINTPTLWSSISMIADQGDYYFVGQTFKISPIYKAIHVWLERAVDVPLDVELNIQWSPHDTDIPIPPRFKEALELIIGTMPRWRTAMLHLNVNSDFAQDIREWARGPTPLLRSLTTSMALERSFLSMELEGGGTGSISGYRMISLDDVPRLKHLGLIFYDGIPRDLTWPVVSYERLKTLRLTGSRFGGIKIEDIVPVFEGGRNLVHCHFDYLQPPTVEGLVRLGSRNTPALLRDLRYLHIGIAEDWFLAHTEEVKSLTVVLDYVTAPVLETLGMSCGGRYWDQDPFMAFMTRSSCSLSTLYFIKTPIYTQDVLDCLRRCPGLRRFHVGQEDPLRRLIDPEFADGMSAWDGTTQRFELCHELEWFSFDKFDSLNLGEVDILASLLKTRRCPPDNRPTAFTTFRFDSKGIAKDPPYRVRAGVTRAQSILDLLEHPTGLRIDLDSCGYYDGDLLNVFYNFTYFGPESVYHLST